MRVIKKMMDAGVARDLVFYSIGVAALKKTGSGHLALSLFREGSEKLTAAEQEGKWPHWRWHPAPVYDLHGACVEVAEVALASLLNDMVERPLGRGWHSPYHPLVVDAGEGHHSKDEPKLLALLLTFFEVHGLPAEPVGGLRGLLQVSGGDLEAWVAEQSPRPNRAETMANLPQRHCFLTGAKLLASDGRCLKAEEAWGAELQSSAGGAVVISVHPFPARQRDVTRVQIEGSLFPITADHRVPAVRDAGQGVYEAWELLGSERIDPHRVRVTSRPGQPRTAVVEDAKTVTEDVAVLYLEVAGDGSVFMQAVDNDDHFLEVMACERSAVCGVYAMNTFLAVRPEPTQAMTVRSDPLAVRSLSATLFASISPLHSCSCGCVKFIKGKCTTDACTRCHDPAHRAVPLRRRRRPRAKPE